MLFSERLIRPAFRFPRLHRVRHQNLVYLRRVLMCLPRVFLLLCLVSHLGTRPTTVAVAAEAAAVVEEVGAAAVVLRALGQEEPLSRPSSQIVASCPSSALVEAGDSGPPATRCRMGPQRSSPIGSSLVRAHASGVWRNR